MTCRVYRHFDEAGTLLYVGIAACALQRLDQHRLRSKWFGDVRSVRIDPCESREEALRLEQMAIKHERPLYNGPVGRPRVVGDRPWHIEGISRATWYRKLGMSKLDQLKALGDAKRVARKSSDGSTGSRRAGRQVTDGLHSAGREKPKRSDDCSSLNHRQVGAKVQAGTQSPKVALARVAPSPSEAKRGRGRPKAEGPRPWEVAGVSRATWHRRRQKGQKK